MKYRNVLILGTDQFAIFCARIIMDFECPVQIIDTNDEQSSVLFSMCNKLDIPYVHVRKESRTKFFLDIKTQMLLISAINPWIIPNSILSEKRVNAINLHHSLLPRHPGRNAEAWAIYCGDSKAGVTWHLITSDVDGGEMIAQAETKLDERTTALGLLRIQNNLAKESFKLICQDLLNESLITVPQGPRHDKIHYSWERPNNGTLNPDWDSTQISRFIRSMDYGMLKILGDPKILVENTSFTWDSYEISENTGLVCEQIQITDDTIFIYKQDKVFKLKNVQRINT